MNVDIKIPSKSSELAENILEYFYAHPEARDSIAGLASVFAPESADEIQSAIETLVAARLVKGKRISEGDKVRYVKLELTKKGEREAIKLRKRDKKITVRVRNIGSDE